MPCATDGGGAVASAAVPCELRRCAVGGPLSALPPVAAPLLHLQVNAVVFDNGLVRMSFTQSGGSILLTSAVVNGTELQHGATGASWYIDAAGHGTLEADHIKIVRVTPDLVEAAWIDSHSATLHHEHHLIMVRRVLQRLLPLARGGIVEYASRRIAATAACAARRHRRRNAVPLATANRAVGPDPRPHSSPVARSLFLSSPCRRRRRRASTATTL